MQNSQPAATAHHWYQGLDGVRAIAVTMVFIHHYYSRIFIDFGWTGVQVFFVLSGFLITGILFDSRREPFRYAALAVVLYYALVLAVSVLSYHFLESPFLRLKSRFTFGTKTAETALQHSAAAS